MKKCGEELLNPTNIQAIIKERELSWQKLKYKIDGYFFLKMACPMTTQDFLYRKVSVYLQVPRQRQERPVDLALVNSSAVPHTLHPQAFHVSGGCDDVGAHVGCAAPVWEQGGDQRSCEPQ